MTSRLEIWDYRNEYCEATYSSANLKIDSSASYVGQGFVGSEEALVITAEEGIQLEAPVCVAAKYVTLLARDRIAIGTAGQLSDMTPVRIYAKELLNISTEHLILGSEVQFVVFAATTVFISCKKISIVCPHGLSGGDPPLYPLLRLWAKHAEIEVLSPQL